MKEKLNRIPSHWRKLFLLLLSAVGSLVIGVTAAAIIHEMSLENRLKTPTVEAEVVEDLTEGKKVQFQNNGTANVFIRVAWAESWNLPGSPDEVLSNYCQDTDGEWVQVAEPQWLRLKDDPNTSEDEQLWQDGGDGWWYYRKVLPPKEKSGGKGTLTPPILETVKFQTTELLEADQMRYENAAYDLHFTVEEVQASADYTVSKDAIKELFGDGVTMKPAEAGANWETVWANKADQLITWEFPSNSNGTRLAEEAETGGEGN